MQPADGSALSGQPQQLGGEQQPEVPNIGASMVADLTVGAPFLQPPLRELVAAEAAGEDGVMAPASLPGGENASPLLPLTAGKAAGAGQAQLPPFETLPPQQNGTAGLQPQGSGAVAAAGQPVQDPPCAPPSSAPALAPAAAPAAEGGEEATPAAVAPLAAAETPAAAPQMAAADATVAAEELESILGRIAQLDGEGWFQHPVREQDTPGYHKIIRKPCCFEVMRQKIRQGQYVNWQELVRDFELICNNAMRYNQKRSRIHKLALVMLRAGKKLLAEVEMQGRRAISRLEPAQPSSGMAAAAVAAAAAGQVPQAQAAAPAVGPGTTDPLDSLAPPSSTLRGATAGAAPPGSTPLSLSLGLLRSQSTLDTAGTLEDSDCEMVAVLADPAADSDGEAEPGGYSSYEGTDMEDEGVDQQQLDRQPGAELAQYASIDAVLRQPWPSSDAGEPSPSGQGAAAPGAAVAPAPSHAHSQEWKAARGSMEWRAHWLELRLLELGQQRRRYQQQLAAVQQQEQQQQAAAAKQEQQQQSPKQEQQEPAASAPQPSGSIKQEQQQQAAPEAGPPPQRTWQHQHRRALPELQLPTLLEHPFFREHSLLGKRRREHPDAAAGAAAGAAGCAPGAPPPAFMDTDDYPAEAYTALELLDRRLAQLRQQLMALQQPAGQGQMQRPSLRVPSMGRPVQRRGSGGLTPRSSARYGPPRKDSLYRDLSLTKRRRTQEYDAGEVLGAPKYVERPQVKTIDTPTVRVLTPAELKRRQAAVEQYELQLRQGLGDKAAAEAIDALCDGESSGEEEIGDESYAVRHARLEAEERARYESYAPGGSMRKKPGKLGKERSKQPMGKHPHRTVSAPAGLAAAAAAAAAASAPAAAATPSAPAGLAAQQPRPQQQQQQQQQATPQQPAPAQPAQQQQQPQPAAAAVPKAPAAPPAALAANGIGMMVLPMQAMPPALAAQMTQMAAAAAAAGQAAAAAQAAAGKGGAASAVAAANSAAAMAGMLRAPFQLPPAVAAAAAAAAAQHVARQQAAADPHAQLPAALQAIIPNGPPAPAVQQQQQQPLGARPPGASGRGRGRPPGRSQKGRR